MCPPKMGGTISGMTKRSITGRPEIRAIMREVWADQIDDFGEPCPVCQLVDRDIECNVYVPRRRDDAQFFGTCRCCSTAVVLDVVDRDFDRDVIIEFSGGARK